MTNKRRPFSTDEAPIIKGTVYGIMNEAVERDNGVLIGFTSASSAVSWRNRCYRRRAKEQEKATTKDSFGITRPGTTSWDNLIFKIIPATELQLKAYPEYSHYLAVYDVSMEVEQLQIFDAKKGEEISSKE